jgi:hypothetical protein
MTHLFIAEQMAEAEIPPPPAPTEYMVRAFWTNGPWWTFKGMYDTFEQAELAAKSLPRSWARYQIWRIGSHE